jgi:hypothetical protein
MVELLMKRVTGSFEEKLGELQEQLKGWSCEARALERRIECLVNNYPLCAGETAQQDAAHGKIKQYLAGLDQAFVVLGEPPVGGQPGDCPFNHPPSRKHLKAPWVRRRL